jgi:large subunit ribosomal protein L25
MSTGTEEIVLATTARSALGRKVRALRKQAITPLHIYGRGEESLNLQASTEDTVHAIGRVGFARPLIIKISSAEHFVVVREVQRHPVTDAILHVDFLRVSRTERRVAQVPITLRGDAPAARAQGATLTQDLHAVEVEALPTDLPSSLSIDVSSFTDPNGTILVSALELPRSVTLLTDPDTVIARVTFQRTTGEVSEGGEPKNAITGEASSSEEHSSGSPR